MANTSCINGHSMWDGDGGPIVEVYRIGFFRDLLEREPDCVIRHDFWGKYPYIYDCMNGVPGEDLDVWYCDQCGSFIVFIEGSKERLDYIPCDKGSMEGELDYRTWEEYIALRETAAAWEAFHDFSDGKNPLAALLNFGFRKRYYLSPDRKVVVEVEEGKGITAVYQLARVIGTMSHDTDA